jgi:hypothetical protein
MDKILNFKSLLAAIVVAFIMTSCEKAPEAEITEATKAVESAKQAEADIYAAAQFNALQDTLGTVLAKVEEQKGKTFATYGNLKQELTGIASLAVETANTAQANKAQAKEELTAALQELLELLEADKTLLASAPKGKGGAAVVEEINIEIAGLEASYNEINVSLDNANYIESKNKVQVLKAKAEEINAELKEAISKVGKGKA